MEKISTMLILSKKAAAKLVVKVTLISQTLQAKIYSSKHIRSNQENHPWTKVYDFD